MLISCGENLLNLKANCDIKDEMELMKLILSLGHLCPSSTFSLPINSYNSDPLVLSKIPHIMINGKCEQY